MPSGLLPSLAKLLPSYCQVTVQMGVPKKTKTTKNARNGRGNGGGGGGCVDKSKVTKNPMKNQ